VSTYPRYARKTDHTPDRALAEVASAQHGVVTRAQLLNAGVSGDAIHRRVKAGRLISVHRGVFAVGHLPPSPHARAMAAVLACGPDAVLSHRSAGALYGLIRYDGPVDVTAPTNRAHRGIALHRSRHIERTLHYGIPVTTPARTLVDLAGLLDAAALTRAVNEARLRHLLSDDALITAANNAPGRKTTGLIPTHAPTRSAFEDAFLAFVDRYDLPRPEVNQIVHGYEVDMLWRPQRLVAELDGRQHAFAFEIDRERDAHLLAHGLSTIRITWRRLTGTPAKEARRLRTLLTKH
jgi:Transcriptional regulator, AbiEi antitoxin/Protein of unknown function (DUF559)